MLLQTLEVGSCQTFERERCYLEGIRSSNLDVPSRTQRRIIGLAIHDESSPILSVEWTGERKLAESHSDKLLMSSSLAVHFVSSEIVNHPQI